MARKHVGWYSKGLPASGEFRARIMTIDDPVLVRAEIDAFYAPLVERSAA
jgi:tRNA-dihydrouridine synthase B